MKKLLLVFVYVAYPVAGYAECVALQTVYTACKPGYYLSDGQCLQCPPSDSIMATTADKNSGDKTSCFIQSDTNFSDESGYGTYTGNCYYGD